MSHWLGRGADGWRLDAAYAVPGVVLGAGAAPGPRQPSRRLVRRRGDPRRLRAFVAGSGVDSVTQYELWKAIWSSLNDGNFHELDWALQRHNDFLDTFAPLTFVGNHDVTRIASKLERPEHLAHALVLLFTTGGVPVDLRRRRIRLPRESKRTGPAATTPCGPNSARPQPHSTTTPATFSTCTDI